MAEEAKLIVRLEAQIGKLEKQLQDADLLAEKAAKKIEGRFSKINPGSNLLQGFFQGIGQEIFRQFNPVAIVDFARTAIKELAEVGNVAKSVGVSIGQLQELHFAFEQSGASVQQADAAMQRFAVSIARAGQGEGVLAKFLSDNNVAIKTQGGALRSTADILSDVANLMKNTADPADKLAIAANFFGREAGPAMVKALENGATGLRDMGTEARKAGIVLSDEVIKKAQELDDKFNKLVQSSGAWIKGLVVGAQGLAVQLATAALAVGKLLNTFPQTPEEMASAAEFGRESRRPGSKGQTSSLIPPSTAGDGKKTNTSALAGGGGSDSSAFQRAMDQMQKRIALTDAETASVGKNTFEKEKAKSVALLLAAAQAEGLKITPQLTAKIDEQAEAMARSSAAAEKATTAFAQQQQAINFAGQELIGVLDMIREGGHSAEDIVKRLADNLIRAAEQALILGQGPLAGLFGTAGVGGNAGGLMGAIFGGFRAGGGSVDPGKVYAVGERGMELFAPRTPGVIVPSNAMKSLGGGGITVVVTSNPTFQAGMTPTDIAAIKAMQDRNNGELRRVITQDIRTGLGNNRNYLAG